VPTRPYPDRGRAERAVHRRRDSYRRTVIAKYTHCLQRVALGFDAPPFEGPTTAEVLAPYREREAYLAARVRARMRQLEPAFERLYLNSRISSLDT